MRIDVDYDSAGHPHYVETDVELNPSAFDDPNGGTAKLTILELLAVLNKSAKAREIGGWNEVSNIKINGVTLTRWEVLCQMANSPMADAEVVALHLKP